MMKLKFSGDVPKDMDQPPYEAAAERPGKPIRVRLQPTLFRKREGRTGGEQQAWPGVSWLFDCQTPEEAIALRDALRLFFVTAAELGPAEVSRRLEEIKRLFDGSDEADGQGRIVEGEDLQPIGDSAPVRARAAQ